MYVLLFADLTSAVAWQVFSKCKELKLGYYSEYTANYNQNCCCGPMTKGDKETLLKIVNDKTKSTVMEELE